MTTTTASPRASIEPGHLLGQWEDGVAVFRGVPFGAPPVGALRWRPPQRPMAWDGERSALEFGPAPLQPQPPRNSIMFHTNFDDRRPLVMSEDCLYLNVWTPEPSGSAGLPVMVWIQGGGNRYGYGSQDIHNGRAIAARGVVVVTLNHRLGALGFLAHPELAAEDDCGASGNYGLLDIVAALTWVQENVASFGGDPSKVTLAGNSAGAAHVCHLMASTITRSLFRAVIGQSAAGIYRAEGPMPDQAKAENEGLRYSQQFGAGDLAALRRISGIELIVKGHFGPVVDGRVLTRDSQDVFDAGEQHAVPLLVGSNVDEGANFTSRNAADDLKVQSAKYGAGSPFDALYPTGDPALAKASARLFIGECRFGYPVWRWAKTQHETTGAATWVYRFAHTPPLPHDLDLATPPDGVPGYGVFHTAELPYTADNLAQLDWPWKDVDRELSAAMGDAWARFVQYSDPNGAGLPKWNRFDGADDAPVLVFGDTIEAGGVDRLAAMQLLDELPRPL
jgi:para-nitrobenzyl esterase